MAQPRRAARILGWLLRRCARGAVNHPANSCDDRHAICVEIESAIISATTKAREDSVSCGRGPELAKSPVRPLPLTRSNYVSLATVLKT